tara:strand:+ start:266 stop:415 length:150 start_codon:yes stop_codon:yes gene_type:complete
VAIIKYQISKVGKGTKNKNGKKTTNSIMLVNPIMPRGLVFDLIILLQPA